MVTGVSLALYYTPTAETAHTSLAYITKQVAGGAFLRSLHSYGSSAMIIVLALHFLQTFTYGSFKGRRELLWISGAVLSMLVLGMGFTGYLLPWDQKAYFATAVGTNIAGQMPLIGNLLTRLLRGGETLGTLTLSRFYVAHVFLIPSAIYCVHRGAYLPVPQSRPGRTHARGSDSPKLHPERFYPRQVLFDMVFALLIMGGLAALSYLRPVTLGPIANPSDSHFPSPARVVLPAHVSMAEVLGGTGGRAGVIVIPGLLATGFFLMPFLDRRLERKIWRRPIPALAVAIVVAGMVSLGIKSQLDDQSGPWPSKLPGSTKRRRRTARRPSSHIPLAPLRRRQRRSLPWIRSSARAKISLPIVAAARAMATTEAAPPWPRALVGITNKLPKDRLAALLHNPSAKMKAGGMPDVDATPDEMDALIAYLGTLGKPAPDARSAANVLRHGSGLSPAERSDRETSRDCPHLRSDSVVFQDRVRRGQPP